MSNNIQRTIIDFIKLDKGINNLLDIYEDLIINKPDKHHEISSHYQTIVFLKIIMSKEQWNRFEIIKQKESNKGYFMCGTCGHQGQMILIYSDKFIALKKPSFSSVENWTDIYLKAFGDDIIVSKTSEPEPQ